MASLEIVSHGAPGDQHRIGSKEASRLDVHNELSTGMKLGQIAGDHDAYLVGENFPALVIDEPATVAVAVKTEADIGPARSNGYRDGMKHFHVFGIGIVVGETVVELG